MTKRLLDFNPVSGEKVWFQYDQADDQMTITHEQDVSKHLDLAHEMAIDAKYTAHGMKKDMWHYAHVPNTTMMKMLMEDGVDMFNRDHQKRAFELLNSKYKRCKTTEKTHVPRR